MRIILNTSILLAQRAGIGTYVAELAAALQRLQTLQLVFFDGREIHATLNYNSSNTRTRWAARLRNIPGAYTIRHQLTQRNFDRAVKKSQPDIYHDPSLWPLQFSGPTVMTVHDLTHIDFAWTQPRMRVREIERKLPYALERVARVLVDSQFIANQLQQHYSVSPNKIVIAPLAPVTHCEPRRETQITATLTKLGLRYRSYFLFIGTLEPRKNLLLALRAHAQLPNSIRKRFPLIIAGGAGWHSRDTERALAAASTSGDARKLGYLERDELADVLAGAKLFIFPSLYEGFGIPVLEAMASGVPVISSDTACLPEVGGDAARYFNPSDHAGLTALMTELIEDETECERLVAAGVDRVKLFSWDKCAAITAEAYRAALAQN